ncbi:hypothetical protein AABM26_02265 [Curtobacterium aetherium]|uniref:hypothetical protein n=1 Tax=Curtobacterium aetherium TaxID=2841594 RepID=UPI003B5217E0
MSEPRPHVPRRWRLSALLVLVLDVLMVLPLPFFVVSHSLGLASYNGIAYGLLTWGAPAAVVLTVIALVVVPAPRGLLDAGAGVLAVLTGVGGIVWLGVAASFGGAAGPFGLLLLGAAVLMVVLIVRGGPRPER